MKRVIEIIAPASPSSEEELILGLAWIKKHGFHARVRPDILNPDVFFAAPLKTQLKHLKEALYAKDSEAVWCLRGGYGCMRLIPEMMKWKKPAKEKVFLGFSDITTLHTFLAQKWGWKTYHGPNLSATPKKDPSSQDVKEVIDLMTDLKLKKQNFSSLYPMNNYARKKTKIEAKVVGGNLRLIQSGLKTDHELKMKNKIVFIEDIGERGYSLHRMLEQLIQASAFEGVKAVIFGDFSEGLEKDNTDLKWEALERFAMSVPFPVFSGLPAGHESLNRIVPFNTKATLKTGVSGELIY